MTDSSNTRAMPRVGRGWLQDLALLVVSAAVGAFGIEVGLRALGYVPERYSRIGLLADPGASLLLDSYPTNPRGYFEIDLRRPESRERYSHLAPARYDTLARRAPYAVEFRYNALRFRDAPFGPKRAGMRRVMILGDSFTEGQGVKERDTTARVLERLLNADDPGHWEVLNCGRRGSDSVEIFEAFEEVLRFEPDVLVYAMVLNDPDRSEAFHARQKFIDDWIVARGKTLKEPQDLTLVESRLAAFVADRLKSWRVGRDTTRWYLDMYGPPNREGWERTQESIRQMSLRTRAQGGAFLVAVWPLLVDLEGAYPFVPAHEAIARFCLGAGIPHHDLLSVFRGRASAPLWVHPVDRHPNDVAHRLAAESLLPVIKSLATR